jgi:hypothetical protein
MPAQFIVNSHCPPRPPTRAFFRSFFKEFLLQTYPRHTKHSLTHYRSVLLVLISGLVAGVTHAALAQMLNDAHVSSATGVTWTTQAVKSVLKKLRLKTGPNYHAMLELCFSGSMSPAQCRPLLQAL